LSALFDFFFLFKTDLSLIGYIRSLKMFSLQVARVGLGCIVVTIVRCIAFRIHSLLLVRLLNF